MNAALLFFLQSTVAGQALPADQNDDANKIDYRKQCDNSASTEIVVCARKDPPRDQRITPLPPIGPKLIDDGGRLSIDVGKVHVSGGGPMGKNGQSVGLGFRLRL